VFCESGSVVITNKKIIFQRALQPHGCIFDFLRSFSTFAALRSAKELNFSSLYKNQTPTEAGV